MANRLEGATSPYLLQHVDNPVDWWPWTSEALATAEALDRPIFLSVGYAACHWCHVMARESFSDTAIAEKLNDHFVSIKVDREERPDIDSVYMDAVTAVTGRGGWPMSVFLAPDGRPFFAGTYLNTDRFSELLDRIIDLWNNDRTKIGEQCTQLTNAIAPRPPRDPDLSDSLLDQAATVLRKQWDHENGGLGQSPKFPQANVLDFLLRNYRRTDNRLDLAMVEQSLQRMSKRGLFDQLAGGFSRYCVDERWTVPHFEKMLYDNALLVPVYVHAYQATGKADYQNVAERTLDWMLGELRQKSGGFASAVDADSDGGEGTYYVWTPEQVLRAVGPDLADLACAYYGVTEHGNFEGATSVLSIANPNALNDKDLATVRRRMLTARQARIAPIVDDKILASWNGLAMTAFAEAGRILGRGDYVNTARGIAHHISAEMVVDGRVHHSWRDGQLSPESFCEDHAAVALGMLHLYQAHHDERHFVLARDLTYTMIELFADEEGGFFSTASDAEQLVKRPQDITDTAVPSANSLAATACLRLYHYTGDRTLREIAKEALRLPGRAMGKHPSAFGKALSVLSFLRGNPSEVAVVGQTTELFYKEFSSVYLPFGVMAASNDTTNTEVPLLRGKTPLAGETAAYVCRDFMCDRPVTNPAAFRTELH